MIPELTHRRLPSAGRSLELLGIAHAAVGAVVYRRAWGSIARGRVVNTVPDHGERATAWWFMIAAPLMWSTGRLLRAAAANHDRDAEQAVGTMITAIGTLGVLVIPRSPFWAVALTGVRACLNGRRHAA